MTESKFGQVGQTEPGAVAPSHSTLPPWGDLKTVRNVLDFPGTAPVPLARYLKGLGLLRLVAEQRDPDAVGWWQDEQFHLATALHREDLEDFFLEQYRPTPIVAPWNGGSGFYGRDQALSIIANSQAHRWAVYRQTIAISHSLLAELGLQGKPDKVDKRELVQACRNRLPDEAVAWMDATLVLTNADVAFPPITGTGGNDGNLEFTNNFMQRLGDLMSPTDGAPTRAAHNWLQSSLWGNPAPGLVKAAIGQFSPGQAGGPNASRGFSGESLVNPWDYVLMLEGVLLFAAAAAKRLESSNKTLLSAPFTVYAIGVGNGSTAETDERKVARAETWLPLWRHPASLAEVAYLFREGRAQVTGNRVRRNAQNGVDFARACATLAVDRGIDSFQRYSFLMRSGNAYLAVPLTRFAVRRQAYAELLTELDTWLEAFARGVNGKNASHTLQSALRQIRQAIFAYCQDGGSQRMQALLIAVGKADELLTHTPKAREGVRPLTLKNPQWWAAADDGSDEFRLAQAFVCLQFGSAGAIRANLSPVHPVSFWQWDSQANPPRVVWRAGGLVHNLVAVLQRRLLDENHITGNSDLSNTVDSLFTNFSAIDPQSADIRSVTNEPQSVDPHSVMSDIQSATRRSVDGKPFTGRVAVPLATVLNFMTGRVSDRKIGELIWGLLPLTGVRLSITAARLPRAAAAATAVQSPFSDVDRPIPWAYALAKLVCSPNSQLQKVFALPSVPVPGELVTRLASGRVEEAADVARRQLQASGLSSPFFQPKRMPNTPGVEGLRLAAALVFPLSNSDLRRLAAKTWMTAEEKEASPPVSP